MSQTYCRLVVFTAFVAALTSFSAFAQSGTTPTHGDNQMHKMHSEMQKSTKHHQPYAGLEKRKIKALSMDRMEGLMAGKGIGYALAAELNKYPGPLHVLDMANDLGLSVEQQKKVRTLFDQMKAKAVVLGKAIIAKEALLDRAFANGKIDHNSLETMVADIARQEGQLRAAHLSTHLDMKSILTHHQVKLYNQLRGYSGEVGKTMSQ